MPPITTSATNAVFVAAPFTSGNLTTISNTLNNGDSINDSAGDGSLSETISFPTKGGNPPFASNVTLSGIANLTITNLSGVNDGFSGKIDGLTTVTDTFSMLGSNVTLGAIGAGNGLKTGLFFNFTSSNSNAGFTASAWRAAC